MSSGTSRHGHTRSDRLGSAAGASLISWVTSAEKMPAAHDCAAQTPGNARQWSTEPGPPLAFTASACPTVSRQLKYVYARGLAGSAVQSSGTAPLRPRSGVLETTALIVAASHSEW